MEKIKRVIVLFYALLLSGFCLAQTYNDYYHRIEGLKKAELKTALHKIIQPIQVLKYGGKGAGYTWSGFVSTDSLPEGGVLDRYSFFQRNFNGINAVDGMNIEHAFANSWWGHTVNNAYCDLFNLFPSDGVANGRKSNNPIGEVTEYPQFDNGVIKVGKSTSYKEDSLITVWEPGDNWKGDFARTYFYMATCYEDYIDQWQTKEGLLMIEKSTYPTLKSWVLKLLLEWDKKDPVDEIEKIRNERVFLIQGNRNPFVDYPELSAYIWGDSTTYAFYINPQAETPELFIPMKNDTLNFGLQSLSKGLVADIDVRGRNLTNGIALSVDNDRFSIDGKTTLSNEELTQGVRVRVSCNPLVEGMQQTTITLKGDGFVQTNILRADFVTGIPAYHAKDIVCTVNNKSFVASWMEMQPNLQYTLNVYTKDVEGNRVSITGYPKEITGTSVKISALKANTLYYYNVTLYGSEGEVLMKSNEVAVQMPKVEPVFSIKQDELIFTTSPGYPSVAQRIDITALEVPEYNTFVSVDYPFEVSVDRINWLSELNVTGGTQFFHIRLRALSEEGSYEGELILSTPNVPEIVASVIGQVDKQKSFFENFENGSKTAYAEATVNCSSASWIMTNALLGSDQNDLRNNSKSVRMKVVQDNTTKAYITKLETTTDKLNGCDTLSFYAGLYGKDTGAKLKISYSLNQGTTWIPLEHELVFKSGEWKRYAYYLNVKGHIRLKFEGMGINGKRLNIDDIQMNDYTDSQQDGIEKIPLGDKDKVKVYTLDGILIRQTQRKDALRGLPRQPYLIK